MLLICRTREKVLAIDEALRAELNVKIGLFHEDLTLLQRDRNAAWFAKEDGAQVLICSEIGSEGSVTFSLPIISCSSICRKIPVLLEQRIGRLDRIGQTETISIHVPFPKHSHLDVLAQVVSRGVECL